MQQQTPEELAAQEAEREKVLQESMQQEVVGIVLDKLGSTINDIETRQKLTMQDIETSLLAKAVQNEKNLVGSVKNLEKYIEEVHSQQITDYSTLKKIITDGGGPIGIADAPRSPRASNGANKNGSKGDSESHLQCSKDYLNLCREQKRVD